MDVFFFHNSKYIAQRKSITYIRDIHDYATCVSCSDSVENIDITVLSENDPRAKRLLA